MGTLWFTSIAQICVGVLLITGSDYRPSLYVATGWFSKISSSPGSVWVHWGLLEVILDPRFAEISICTFSYLQQHDLVYQ